MGKESLAYKVDTEKIKPILHVIKPGTNGKEGAHPFMFLPWKKRTRQSWTELGKEKTTRLFHVLNLQNSFIEPDLIDKFGLNDAFELFWGNDLCLLNSDLQIFMIKNVPQNDPRNLRLTTECAQIFDCEPRLFKYLKTASLILKNRNRNKETISSEYKIFDQVQKVLKLNNQEKQEIHEMYQKVVECFMDLSSHFSLMAKKSFTDFSEQEEIGFEKLCKAVIHNFWDPIIIDPKWTVDRFTGTLYASRGEDCRNQKDTKSIETSIEALHPSVLKVESSPEKHFIKQEAENNVLEIINSFSDSEKTITILTMKFIDGLTDKQIREIFNIPQRKYKNIINLFKKYAINIISSQPDTKTCISLTEGISKQNKIRLEQIISDISENKKIRNTISNKEQGSPWWEDFLGNIEKYMELFNEKGAMISPSRRKWTQAFFDTWKESGTKDKKKLLDVVSEKFINCKPDTIRRGIQAAIGQITYREPLYSEGEKRMGRNRYEEALLFKEIYSLNRNDWNSFSDKEKVVIKLFYFDYLEGTIRNQKEIGEVFGIYYSNVSRLLTKIHKRLIGIKSVKRN